MHEYDVVLKLLLQGSARQTLLQVTHMPIVQWLNVELPEVVRNTRIDLLGQTAAGELIHLELQSNHEEEMPLRMAEYCLRIYRSTGKLPRQILLYVGHAPLRMQSALTGTALSYQYQLVDIRTLDGDDLLASPNIGDNVLAVLGRLRNQREAVQLIVARIAAVEAPERELLLRQLLILAGLRRLEEVVEGEAKKMPILESILDNRVLGREYKRGLKEGKEEGKEEGKHEGRAEGRHEGERKVISRQIERRFGPLSESATQKLAAMQEAQLGDLSLRLLDAQSLDELFL